MDERDAWIDETQRLIAVLEQERLPRAQERLASAKQAVQTVTAEINALHVALKIYREVHELPAEVRPPSREALAPYFNQGAKAMMAQWAQDHDGQIVVRDAAYFLIAGGLFKDYTQAAGTLYPSLSRMPNAVKIARGIYRVAP